MPHIDTRTCQHTKHKKKHTANNKKKNLCWCCVARDWGKSPPLPSYLVGKIGGMVEDAVVYVGRSKKNKQTK